MAKKVAVVTGAAGGIGKELTLALDQQGITVIAVDINESGLKSDCIGKNICCTPADVGTVEGQTEVKKRVDSFGGKLDILCHVANVFYLSPLLEMDLATFRQAMATNMEGPIFLTKALLPNIKAAEGKCRITIHGSAAADVYMALPWMGQYFGSKCMVKSVYKHLSVELGDTACIALVNAGVVDTPFWEKPLKNDKWPMGGVLGPRFAEGTKDCHTAAETGKWVAAILDESKVDDKTFKEVEFNQSNPNHWYGVEMTQTTEIKAELEKAKA